MKSAKQRDFFDDQREHAPRRRTHGGETQGLRKIRRPLDRRRPVHLVLKSDHARDSRSFLAPRNRLQIDRILTEWSVKFGVTLHHRQNVGNHLHLVVSFARPEEFQNFLRTIAALIARHVTGARRGKPFGRRFWKGLAFTRVIMGWRDFKGVARYLFKNKLEAEIHPLARKTVEQYDAAVREARRKGCEVWRILEEWSIQVV